MFDDTPELTEALNKIGVTYRRGGLWPVVEEDYVKFMSDRGTLDSTMCDEFEEWLKSHGFTYERHRDRAIRKIDIRACDIIWRAMNWSEADIEETAWRIRRRLQK